MEKLIQSESLLVFCFLLSLVILFSVYLKTAPDFPVIVKPNDFGYNFLTQRLRIWYIPLLSFLFIAINKLIYQIALGRKRNLSLLVKFVNLEIAVLTLIISLQVFFLNL